MKQKNRLDIFLHIWKFVIIALLLFMLILSVFTSIRSVPSELAGKGDPDFHSGFGLTAFLLILISLGWNFVCALLAIGGIAVSHFYKTSQIRSKHKKHFILLSVASPLSEAVVFAVLFICATIINMA